MAARTRKSELFICGLDALGNTHRLFLEALRHREQEIIRFLAILGPALGGFVWLVDSGSENVGVFVIGTVGVLLSLLVGALYSLALGYNFRHLTLELAKLEAKLQIVDSMLEGWPRSREKFLERYKLCCFIPWCTPPEIIKVFWLAFLVGIVGVTVAASVFEQDALVLSIVIPFGSLSFLVGLFSPIHFGCKLRRQCEQEPESWEPLS